MFNITQQPVHTIFPYFPIFPILISTMFPQIPLLSLPTFFSNITLSILKYYFNFSIFPSSYNLFSLVPVTLFFSLTIFLIHNFQSPSSTFAGLFPFSNFQVFLIILSDHKFSLEFFPILKFSS